MGDTLKVYPVEGRAMPREDAPARRITKETVVPNTAYYRRAIERGDLLDEDGHRKTRPRVAEKKEG